MARSFGDNGNATHGFEQNAQNDGKNHLSQHVDVTQPTDILV